MKSKKKFAVMLMGSDYQQKKDYAVLETEGTETHIIAVNTPQQALETVKTLADDGFGAVEVCGAFGEALARQMYEAAGKRLSVGFVICPSDQKEMSDRFWSQQD